MNTMLKESTLIVHSQAPNEEMLGLWAPQPELRCEKEEILEQVANFEQALALLLENPTDLACQKHVQWCAKRMAALLHTCGFPFAARLVIGIEQMLINELFFEDFWRLQLAEFADAVYETVRRGLLLTTPQEMALFPVSLQPRNRTDGGDVYRAVRGGDVSGKREGARAVRIAAAQAAVR